MHNALNTRKTALHEHWEGDAREWHSENQGWFLVILKIWVLGQWEVWRFLDLSSFGRACRANQLDAMFDNFFWNLFLCIISFIQLLHSLSKGCSHFLLCIPIYHFGGFPPSLPWMLLTQFPYLFPYLLPCAIC